MATVAAPATPRPNALAWLALSVVLIVLDQLTKWVAVERLDFQQPVAFLPGFWNWTLTHNTGAAFSFLADAGGWQHAVFVGARGGDLRRAGDRTAAHAAWRLARGAAVRADHRRRAGQRHRPACAWATWWTSCSGTGATSTGRCSTWPTAASSSVRCCWSGSACGIRTGVGWSNGHAPTWSRVLMDIVLANPRGFCAGVDRAIEIVKRAIETLGAPIYVRHEVVHNRFVVEDLRARGAVFVEELDEVPTGGTVIFSAHGVSQAVRADAASRGLRVFDATCPLVTKVHIEVARHCRAGRDVILIGHAGHPEVEGTMGQWLRDEPVSGTRGQIYIVEDVADALALQVAQPDNVAYTTQTTLSVDETRDVIETLRARYPALQGRATTTSATPRRTARTPCASWRASATWCWWSARSTAPTPTACASWPRSRARPPTWWTAPSTSTRPGCRASSALGVTAGASAPEVLVQGVIARLQQLGGGDVRELHGEPEDMVFALPKELRVVLLD
jgi:4-hydroxy-3-methylbut-2-enyl diphosphate reductase